MASNRPRRALRALYNSDPETGQLPQGTNNTASNSLIAHRLVRPHVDADGRYVLTPLGLERRGQMRETVRLYQEPRTARAVAQLMNITPSTVTRWLEAADVPLHTPGIFKAKERREIARAYTKGRQSLEQIAASRDVSIMTVQRALEKEGVPRRPPGTVNC